MFYYIFLWTFKYFVDNLVSNYYRALKTKTNTPKYGLLFNSTYIGRANQKNKGRISRYLANKCSIASRIDCFAGTMTGNLFYFSNHSLLPSVRAYEHRINNNSFQALIRFKYKYQEKSKKETESCLGLPPAKQLIFHDKIFSKNTPNMQTQPSPL